MLILIIEDNRPLASNIIEYLESEGFDCDYAERGDHGLELASNGNYDAIILDIMLPKLNGLQLCQKLRESANNTPVLMLTARDTLEDKLQGFDKGADDYLVKPFDLPELVARIKVMLRHRHHVSECLQLGDLSMDIARHKVTRNGVPIDINPVCWKILEALLRVSPDVLSRQKIEQLIWQDQPPDSDALKSHIYQLRKAIDKPFTSALIHTVRGVGIVLKQE